MFQTAPGVTIPFPYRILEEYQIYAGKGIRANVSHEKLFALVVDFYKQLEEPLFLVLQLALSMNEEKEIGDLKTLHQEVLYLDGQTQSDIDSIVDRYGRLLLDDGISQFAIASHQSHEEIFIEKYKLVTIYTQKTEKYTGLLSQFGLRETDQLITVWDTFSNDHPRECRKICLDGLDIFAVADALKKQGMYRAKVIEG